MANYLTTDGLNTRANSFATDFPYIALCDNTDNELITNRISMAGDMVEIGTASNGSITFTITVPATEFISLPATVYNIQLHTTSTGGTVQGTIPASVEKTVTVGDQLVMTFTQTES